MNDVNGGKELSFNRVFSKETLFQPENIRKMHIFILVCVHIRTRRQPVASRGEFRRLPLHLCEINFLKGQLHTNEVLRTGFFQFKEENPDKSHVFHRDFSKKGLSAFASG